jgi:hypothetical protein
MSPGGEWLGLLFCQWHFGPRRGQAPCRLPRARFLCPALTAGAFSLPRADRGHVFFRPRMTRDGFFRLRMTRDGFLRLRMTRDGFLALTAGVLGFSGF